VNIASGRLNELAQRLARLTGEDVETALERAVEERLSRVSPDAPQGDRREAMRTFFDRISRMAVTDSRSADEIIGYGSDGLPR
jgi:antitoxin VapB